MRVVDELERRHKGILNDKLVDPALRIRFSNEIAHRGAAASHCTEKSVDLTRLGEGVCLEVCKVFCPIAREFPTKVWSVSRIACAKAAVL
jgi:hypothetical protein